MIIKRNNNKDLEAEYIYTVIGSVQHEIQVGYKILSGAAKVVFEAIASCFGLGYWRGTKPWIGKEGWRGDIK